MENTNLNKSHTEYFYVSTTRLILYSFITFGIYELYWFYRNWKAIKQNENQKISPFWRAFFGPLFCYYLFKLMLKDTHAEGVEEKYSARNLTIFYIIIAVVASNSDKLTDAIAQIGVVEHFTFNIVSTLFSTLTVLPLVIIQKRINLARNTEAQIIERKHGIGEIIILIFGLIFSFLFFLSPFLTTDSINKLLSYQVEKDYSETNDWIQLTSEALGFEIMLPVEPDHEFETDELSTLRNDMYFSELSPRSVYYVGAFKYPEDIDRTTPEAFLSSEINEIVSSTKGNELISSEFIGLNGIPALDFYIENMDLSLNFNGRIIMTDELLYSLISTQNSYQFNQTNYNYFLNSFIITN